MAKTNTVQAELTLLDKLTAPLKAAAAQVSASTKQMNTAFTSVSNAFSKVNSAMLAITAVLAGGAAFKSAIDEAVNYRLEVNKLSKELGITLLQATGFKEALEDLGLSTDVLSNASRALTVKIGNSGLSIQDYTNKLTGNKEAITSNGDAIMAIISKAQEFGNAQKQGAFLEEAFGRSFQATLPLLRMTREELARVTEATRGNEEVTKQQVDQIYAFKKAQEAGNDTLRDFKLALGDQLIPIITDFSNGLAGNKENAKELGIIIGQVVTILYGGLLIAIEFVIYAVKGLKLGFELLSNTFHYVVSLVEALSLALSGDLSKAFDVAKNATKKYADDVVTHFKTGGAAVDKFIKNSISAVGKTKDLLSGAAPTMSAADEKTKPGGGAIPVTDEASKKNLEAKMQLLDKSIEDIKTKYAGQTTTLRQELQKQIELELENVKNLKLTSDDQLKLRSKLNKDLSALKQDGIAEQLQLNQIEAKGTLTAVQQNNAFLLAQEKSKLDKQQITLEQFFAKKKELNDADILAQETYLNKMLELSKGNAAALLQVEYEKNAAELAAKAMKAQTAEEAAQREKAQLEELQSILVSSFQQSLDGILSGTMSFSDAMANIWQGIGNIFNKIIWQMVEEWIKGEALKVVSAMKTSVLTAAASIKSATVSSGAKATETSLSITNDAAKGTAAAIAAWASKNPIAAIAIGAVIGAAIYALLGNVKSAKGGYANVEMDGQMAQLHKGEMVLPAELAEGIRNIAMGNQASGNSGSVTYNINAMDASSFDTYLKANAGSVFAANKLALRNGSQFA